MRVGEIVRDLTRSFLKSDSKNKKDNLNNPLGLVYSLYKGLDCYLIWQSAGRTVNRMTIGGACYEAPADAHLLRGDNESST
jgi:hypothetical protein